MEGCEPHSCSQIWQQKPCQQLQGYCSAFCCFQSAVFPRIYNHVVPHLNSLQHGFRHNRSCMRHPNDPVCPFSSLCQVDTIYLDMAKALDRVPHQKRLCKLRYLGFRDPLQSWIEDYLTNRRYRVTIEGMASQWKPDTSGAPQGSIIGPILLLIYINNIGSDIIYLLPFTPFCRRCKVM